MWLVMSGSWRVFCVELRRSVPALKRCGKIANLIVFTCFSPRSFNIALWPVWSFFTPLILFTQFMGVIMLISLLGWLRQVKRFLVFTVYTIVNTLFFLNRHHFSVVLQCSLYIHWIDLMWKKNTVRISKILYFTMLIIDLLRFMLSIN